MSIQTYMTFFSFVEHKELHFEQFMVTTSVELQKNMNVTLFYSESFNVTYLAILTTLMGGVLMSFLKLDRRLLHGFLIRSAVSF